MPFPSLISMASTQKVIFDDPRLKNVEFDHIDRPHGAGQGFMERPWSWDSVTGSRSDEEEISYEPGYSYPEKVRVWVHHSEVAQSKDKTAYESWISKFRWDWNLGDPVLADNLGDRVLELKSWIQENSTDQIRKVKI